MDFRGELRGFLLPNPLKLSLAHFKPHEVSSVPVGHMWLMVCCWLNSITSLCTFPKSICSSIFLNGLLSSRCFQDLYISSLNFPPSSGLFCLLKLIYVHSPLQVQETLKTCTHLVLWWNLYSFPRRPDLALSLLDDRWGFQWVHLNKSAVIKRIWLKKLHELEQTAVVWKEQALLWFLNIASSWLAARDTYIRSAG